MENNNIKTNTEGTMTEAKDGLLHELEQLKAEFINTPTKIHVTFVKIVDNDIIEKVDYSFDTEEEAYEFAHNIALSSAYIGLDSWKYSRKQISDIYTFKDTSEIEVMPVTYRILVYPTKNIKNI